MILKPFTGICLLAAAGSGLYLYQTKHHAQVLERNIARTMKSADAVRQRAGLMRAEYALLNDPSRLAELSEQLLPALKTTAPGQFAALADFEKRLPAIGALPTPEPLEPQAPDAVLPKAEPKPEPLMTEPAKPEPPRQPLIASRPAPTRPTVLAAAAPSALAVTATPLPPIAPAPASPVVATPLAPPRPQAAAAAVTSPPAVTQPSTAPLPLHATNAPLRPAATQSAAATPVIARPAAPPMAARPAYAPPAYAPPSFAPPAVGSALGMARSMPAASMVTPAQAPAFAPYGRP